jgi:hypothetical protein
MKMSSYVATYVRDEKQNRKDLQDRLMKGFAIWLCIGVSMRCRSPVNWGEFRDNRWSCFLLPEPDRRAVFTRPRLQTVIACVRISTHPGALADQFHVI